MLTDSWYPSDFNLGRSLLVGEEVAYVGSFVISVINAGVRISVINSGVRTGLSIWGGGQKGKLHWVQSLLGGPKLPHLQSAVAELLGMQRAMNFCHLRECWTGGREPQY